MGGYNVYACEQKMVGVDCEKKDTTWKKLNSSLVSQSNKTLTMQDKASFGDKESKWCFYVEACDNCTTAGTCPGNTEANCSMFDTMTTYRKCLTLTAVAETYAPLFPASPPTVTAPAEGNSCKLEIERTTKTECANGTCDLTPSVDFPAPTDLMGYYVFRAISTTANCNSVTMPEPPTAANGGTGTGAGAKPTFTDVGLENNKTYCYRVYGYDAAGNFSRNEPKPDPVACTPKDTKAPEKPVMTDPIGFDAVSCTPEWPAITDKDVVTYNVYRCEVLNDASCKATANYTKITSEPVSALEYLDDTVTPNHTYMYCATAIDMAPNESLTYESAAHTNCGACTPGNMCKPPTNVIPGATPDKYGVKVMWNNSGSDPDGTTAGYNIYLCSTSSVSSCTTKLTAAPVAGNHSETAYTISKVDVSADGTYYIAVDFKGDCDASAKIISTTAVEINKDVPADPCVANPTSCKIEIKISGAFQKTGLEACTFAADATCKNNAYKKTTTTIAGLKVQVYNKTTSSVVKEVSAGTDGTLPSLKLMESDLTTGNKYAVRAVIPAASLDAIYGQKSCTKDGTTGDCVATLADDVALSPTKAVETSAIQMPDSTTGSFGGEIGNANCDTKVNLQDLMAIKNAYNASRGDACYRAWADFNMDGKVGLGDLMTLKKLYNKTISDAAVSTAVLCQSKDPLPSCCATKSCPK